MTEIKVVGEYSHRKYADSKSVYGLYQVVIAGYFSGKIYSKLRGLL